MHCVQRGRKREEKEEEKQWNRIEWEERKRRGADAATAAISAPTKKTNQNDSQLPNQESHTTKKTRLMALFQWKSRIFFSLSLSLSFSSRQSAFEWLSTTEKKSENRFQLCSMCVCVFESVPPNGERKLLALQLSEHRCEQKSELREKLGKEGWQKPKQLAENLIFNSSEFWFFYCWRTSAEEAPCTLHYYHHHHLQNIFKK